MGRTGTTQASAQAFVDDTIQRTKVFCSLSSIYTETHFILQGRSPGLWYLGLRCGPCTFHYQPWFTVRTWSQSMLQIKIWKHYRARCGSIHLLSKHFGDWGRRPALSTQWVSDQTGIHSGTPVSTQQNKINNGTWKAKKHRSNLDSVFLLWVTEQILELLCALTFSSTKQ